MRNKRIILLYRLRLLSRWQRLQFCKFHFFQDRNVGRLQRQRRYFMLEFRFWYSISFSPDDLSAMRTCFMSYLLVLVSRELVLVLSLVLKELVLLQLVLTTTVKLISKHARQWSEVELLGRTRIWSWTQAHARAMAQYRPSEITKLIDSGILLFVQNDEDIACAQLGNGEFTSF